MRNLILAALLLCPVLIYADNIDDGVNRYFGKIIFISKNKVSIREGCTGKAQNYFWNECTTIYFNTTCDHPEESNIKNPAPNDNNCPKKRVFVIRLLNKTADSYADELTLKDGKLKIVYCHNKATVNLLASNLEKYIEKISYVEMCASDIPDNFPVF